MRSQTVGGVRIALVRIERQIDSQGNELDRTKNRWSTRTALLAGKPAARLCELADQAESNDYISKPSGKPHGTQRQLRKGFSSVLEQNEIEVHLFKNLRKTWQTNARWVLKLPPWVIEPMMGHVGEGITGRHYDKPSELLFAQMLAEAWSVRPFGDEYEWLRTHD